LVDFLWQKGSTHIIAQINAKRTDQKGVETTNQLKIERGKEKNVKNTKSDSSAESRRLQGGFGTSFPT
jgi:hypothetical protein